MSRRSEYWDTNGNHLKTIHLLEVENVQGIWTENLGAPGFNPFDTLAIAWLTHPNWLEHLEGGVWIEPAAGDGPKHLLVDRGAADIERRAIYCHRPGPEFKPMLLARLAGPASRVT